MVLIKDIVNSVGCETGAIVISAECNQIINKSAHIVNSLSSCIDPIFSNNVNVISNYSVDLSIVENIIIISFLAKSTYSPSSKLCLRSLGL